MGLKTLASFVFLLQCTDVGNAANYEFQDMCRYQYFLDKLDWSQASKQCEMYNKTLVILMDAQEENFIKTTLLPNLENLNYKLNTLDTTEFWIGNSEHAVFHSESENLQSPAYGSGCKPFLCVHGEIDYNTCYKFTTIIRDTLSGTSSQITPCMSAASIFMRNSKVIALYETNTYCEGYVLKPNGGGRPAPLAFWLKDILMPSTNISPSYYACDDTSQVDGGDSTTPAEVSHSSSQVDGGDSSTPAEVSDSSSQVDGGDSTTPAAVSDSSSQVDGGDSTTPAAVSDSSSQVDGGDSTTPAEVIDSSSLVDDDGTQSEYSAQRSDNSEGRYDLTPPLSTIPREISTIPDRITTPLSSVPLQITATPAMNGCRSTCPCFNKSAANENITLEELLQSMLKNREQLIVKRETLSSWKRKRYSAQDSRTSSTTIGYIGAGIIGMMIGFLAMMDLPDIVIALRPHCSRKWRRQKASTAKETQTTGQASMDITSVYESKKARITERKPAAMQPKKTPTAGHANVEMISVDERSEKKSMESFMTQPTSYSKVKCRKVYTDSYC